MFPKQEIKLVLDHHNTGDHSPDSHNGLHLLDKIRDYMIAHRVHEHINMYFLGYHQ